MSQFFMKACQTLRKQINVIMFYETFEKIPRALKLRRNLANILRPAGEVPVLKGWHSTLATLIS